MRTLRTFRIVAALIAIVGAIFALQGANVLTNSPVMSGKPTWLYIGIAMVIIGLIGVAWSYARRRRS